jgi:hypothetical protein
MYIGNFRIVKAKGQETLNLQNPMGWVRVRWIPDTAVYWDTLNTLIVSSMEDGAEIEQHQKTKKHKGQQGRKKTQTNNAARLTDNMSQNSQGLSQGQPIEQKRNRSRPA